MSLGFSTWREVSRARQYERLCVREPIEHSRVNLAVGGQADNSVGVGAHDGKHRLLMRAASSG